MQTPLQITFRDMPHSDALESHIREKAAKLESHFSQITACHVTVEQPHKHKHQGKNFCVHISMHVPGADLVVNQHENEDAYVALRDAFDAAKRQVEEYARKLRGEVKQRNNTGRPEAAAAEVPEGE
jgi:ribosomal subunit interface protein